MSALDSVYPYDGSSGLVATSGVQTTRVGGTDPDHAATALASSEEDGIVATFTGAPGAALTYDVAGMLDLFAQTGTRRTSPPAAGHALPATVGWSLQALAADTSAAPAGGVPSQWQNAYLANVMGAGAVPTSTFYAEV